MLRQGDFPDAFVLELRPLQDHINPLREMIGQLN